MASLTGWGRQTWGSGAWGEEAPVELTGLIASTLVGDVTIEAIGNITQNVTGLEADGVVGTATVDPETNVLVTGLATEVDTDGVAKNAVVALGGWGRGTWGEGPFGEALQDDIITTEVGTVRILEEYIQVTGVAAEGIAGTVTATGTAVIVEEGLAASTQISSVTVQADADVSPTGVAAEGEVGTTTQNFGVTVLPTGVSAEVQSGTETITADANVSVTGTEASVATARPLVWGKIVTTQNPNWTEINAA